MRACIHRGASEIGGNCVEIESQGARIVLDIGRPLSATDDDDVPLPPVPGFEAPDAGLLGVLISHGHQDHWGLVEQLPPGVPLYAGQATCAILREAAFFTRGVDLKPAGFLVHRQPFGLGPFTITPYLNDHSAFDTYSLLIEADGRRLFYSADLSGHGRKAGIFEELLRRPPQDVDVLLLEGTSVLAGAGERPESSLSESALEEDCVRFFRETTGMALVSYSAQNIDRLVTLYRAARRSGRMLVLDLYTASVARATRNEKIPHPGPDWPLVAVYVPMAQRIKVKEAGEFECVQDIKGARIFEEELAREPQRYVTKLHSQTAHALAKHGGLVGARAMWSLWSGYLDEPSAQRLRAYLEGQGVPWRSTTPRDTPVSPTSSAWRRRSRRSELFPSTPSEEVGSPNTSTT